ncbi:MAG: Amidophosphoribosyltransferase [Bacteroidetes bacterium]|nr:Amidophosphoribosyltransferase [Bacteroidota bacterium]
MFDDFISLIFPRICLSCGKSLYKSEHSICTYCSYHLPKTNYHTDNENPIAKIFWGRINIHSASAYYAFGKGGKVQHLIHQLKYRGQKDIGVTLGKFYGYDLRKCDSFKTVETIIPVPLHPRKQKKRGYNQSEFFAAGLAETMKAKTDFSTLYRAYESETQTRKSRFSRWKNVETVFRLKDPEQLAGRHILLVDDVITTGATLEACAQTLLQIPGVRISIATIAYASN